MVSNRIGAAMWCMSWLVMAPGREKKSTTVGRDTTTATAITTSSTDCVWPTLAEWVSDAPSSLSPPGTPVPSLCSTPYSTPRASDSGSSSSTSDEVDEPKMSLFAQHKAKYGNAMPPKCRVGIDFDEVDLLELKAHGYSIQYYRGVMRSAAQLSLLPAL